MTVAECSQTSCVWTVSGQVPTLCLDSGIVSPLRLNWVKGVCLLRCNLPPALLAEWPGSFMCHCGNTGVKRSLNKKSQHTKWTLEKKVLPPLLSGFKLATFRSRVCCCTCIYCTCFCSTGFQECDSSDRASTLCASVMWMECLLCYMTQHCPLIKQSDVSPLIKQSDTSHLSVDKLPKCRGGKIS